MAVGSRAIKAGEAFVSMMLDDEEFANAIEEWQDKFRRVSRAVQPLVNAMGGLGAVMVAPFAAGIRSGLMYVSTLEELSRVSGAAVSDLAGLTKFIGLMGGNVNSLGDAFSSMSERLLDASRGSGEAFEELQRLGVDAGALLNAGPVAAFTQLSEVINGIPNELEKIAVAQKVFGDSGAQLVPLMEAWEGMSEAIKSLALSEEAIRAFRELEAALRLTLALGTSLMQNMGATVAPMVTEVVVALNNLLRIANEFVVAFPSVTRWVFVLGATAVVAAGGITLVFSAIWGTIGAAKAFQATLALLNLQLGNTALFSNAAAIGVTRLGAALGKIAAVVIAFDIASDAAIAAWNKVTGDNVVVSFWQKLFFWIEASSTAMALFAELLDSLGLHKLRNYAEFLSGTMHAAWMMLGDQQPTSAGDSAAGASATGVSQWATSSVAGAFANQQTLGFTAETDSALSDIRDNTAATAAGIEAQREEIAIMRRQIERAGMVPAGGG